MVRVLEFISLWHHFIQLNACHYSNGLVVTVWGPFALINRQNQIIYNRNKSQSINHADSFAFICIPAMNDLVQSMVLAGGQWTGSTENLEVPDDISTGKRRKELGAMAFSTTAINFSTVNSSAAFRSKQLVNNKGIGCLLFALCCVTVGNGNSIMTFLCTFFSSNNLK